MAHTFENFTYSYWKNGKPIYSPSLRGREIGEKIKNKIAKNIKFDSFICHLDDGSHVAALHRHRHNKFFCRIDIERFFYSIQRNRLKRVLKKIGISKPEASAKWSTVKNPYSGKGYVLPYGFIQSTILATLVLVTSSIGSYIRGLGQDITVTVYMDDICLSSNNKETLQEAYSGLLSAITEAGFTINAEKACPPAQHIEIFNCNLTYQSTEVLPDRVAKFYEIARTPAGEQAFSTYCDIVKSHKWRSGHE